MWKIIKADIQYFKWLFLWLYLFAMPFYIANAVLGNLQEQLIFIAFYTLPIIGIFVSNEEKRSKRTRLHVALPITIQQLGIVRYPIITVFWISLILLSCLSTFLNRSSVPNLWRILSILATGPLVAACMTIHQDLQFSKFTKSAQIVFRVIIVLLAVVIAILYFATYADRLFNVNLSWIFQNPLFAIVLVISTVVLLLISVRLFENRSTYVM